MGAGAGKNFQSDKTKHAEIILQAVQSYERSHPGEVPSDNFSFQAHLFKRRVLLAVAESKRRGKDVDASLHQLTDADLETLFNYIESNRNNKLKSQDKTQKLLDTGQSSNNSTLNASSGISAVQASSPINPDFDKVKTATQGSSVSASEALAKSSATDNHAMTVEEFVEEDFNTGGDNIDETTSVLSYGDDDRENDSEAEVESSGSLLIHRPNSKSGPAKNELPDEIVEDLEVLDESHRQLAFENNKKDTLRSSGVKIFPAEDTKVLSKEQRIAQTLAKFWEIDEIGSIGSQLELGLESPHPFSPFVAKNDKTTTARMGSAYKDRGQKIDERNERLMGLQRQKVMSYTQNAQLEREVEALQKQLERMEELERSLDMSPSATKLNHSMASSASTFQGSADKRNVGTHGSTRFQENNSKLSNRYSYIYPIDEEVNEWPGGKDYDRHVTDYKISPDQSNERSRGSKHATYSSSDSDEDYISQSTSAVDRLLADDKARVDHQNTEKSDSKENGSHMNQSKHIKHIARQRRKANAANASSGVDSDDSATSNYSGTSNNNPRRSKNVSNSGVNGNASDSDNGNGLQPLSARVKGNNNMLGNNPKRNIVDKDKKFPSSITSITNANQANSSNNANLSNGQSQISGNSPKKSISEARRARNTIGTEEAKPRMKPTVIETNSETEEAMKAHDERASDPRKQLNVKKLNKRRHSVDGLVTSPLKESSASNIPIDNPIVLEKAISALKDVHNDPTAAMENLLTPDKNKLIDHNELNGARSKAAHKGRRKEKSDPSSDGSTLAPRHVLKDDEFGALFAEDPTHVNQSSEINENSVGESSIHVQAPVRKRKVKGGMKVRDSTSLKTESDTENPFNKVWTDDLDHKWIEVSYLLRQPIKTEEDMLYAAASAEAGIMFTDQMNAIAKSLNVLRGQLSRWILPFDSNTRIDTQCSTPHSVAENMPDEFRGKLTERQVHYLVAGANGVRKLVRIKIADDNDLEQARTALQTTNSFFKDLYDKAEKVGLTPFQLLQKGSSI